MRRKTIKQELEEVKEKTTDLVLITKKEFSSIRYQGKYLANYPQKEQKKILAELGYRLG